LADLFYLLGTTKKTKLDNETLKWVGDTCLFNNANKLGIKGKTFLFQLRGEG